MIHADATLTVVAHTARWTRSFSTCSTSPSNGVTVDGRAVRFTPPPRRSRFHCRRGQASAFNTASSIDYGGVRHRRTRSRATDSAGRWTLLRRQLAEPRASLDPKHRSSERQGDGDVARPRADGRTVVANGKLVGTRRCAAIAALSDAKRLARSRGRIPVYLMVIAAAPLVHIRPRRHRVRSRRGQRCVPQSVYTAPEQRDCAARPVRARRRDRATLLAARRPVSVREARAPAVVDALRRDGERERDLLRRRPVSPRHD